MSEITRRHFLAQSGAIVAGASALGLACDSDEEGSSGPDASGSPDAQLDQGGQDAGAADADPDGAEVPDAGPSEPPLVRPEAPVEVTKAPWTMLLPSGALLMRFETREETALTVRLTAEGEAHLDLEPSRTTGVNGIDWPIVDDIEDTIYDEEGEFTLHELKIPAFQLSAGARYRWQLPTGPAEDALLEGGFRVPPAPDAPAPVTLGFIADTMIPNSPNHVAGLASWNIDMLVHGGDIQYQSALVDTWNGMFDIFSPVLSTALAQFCVGNHEFEWGDAEHGEYDEYYLRLVAPPSDEAAARSYYGVTYGHVRVLICDSEAEYEPHAIHDPEGPQYQWLVAELDAAQADAAIKAVIVAFHRPYLCFGRSGMRWDRLEVLHPLFRDKGVTLVLAGHNHAYERFELEGLTYVVDGGGGAIKYSTTEEIEEGKISDEELAWRIVDNRDYGCTRLVIDVDGSIALTRMSAESGQVVDTATLAAR